MKRRKKTISCLLVTYKAKRSNNCESIICEVLKHVKKLQPQRAVSINSQNCVLNIKKKGLVCINPV